jgi:hypothetical protein
MITHFIKLIHCMIVALMLFVPFSNNKTLLAYYIIYVPFIVAHWILNDDTCALTLLECYFSGKSKEESFTGRLVGPLYKVTNNHIYIITFVLYMIAVVRLGRNPIDVYKEFIQRVLLIFRKY